jgi:3-hydroxyisobutyrate dehydrogenase-like beta-hydroxyacid dehydrogenase
MVVRKRRGSGSIEALILHSSLCHAFPLINATGGFASALMQKDLSIAGDAARAVGAPLPMAALAQQMYALLASHGQGGRDFSAVYEFVKGGAAGEGSDGKK